jgi:hypothetical protein
VREEGAILYVWVHGFWMVTLVGLSPQEKWASRVVVLAVLKTDRLRAGASCRSATGLNRWGSQKRHPCEEAAVVGWLQASPSVVADRRAAAACTPMAPPEPLA